MEEHLDLLYLDFLSKYQGKDDAFGVVIDRDCGSHSLEQMTSVQEKCKAKIICVISQIHALNFGSCCMSQMLQPSMQNH